VVGFYKHLISEIPGRASDDAQRHMSASIVSYLCTFLAMRGWNVDLHDAAAHDAAVESLVDFIFRGLGIERG
jgi:hypothetical protein